MTLISPQLDVWRPGDHASVFMGPGLAMVSAMAALDAYWADEELSQAVERKGRLLLARLETMAAKFERVRGVRGRGLVAGLELGPELTPQVSRACFEAGLLVDRCGPRDSTLLLMPPLTIPVEELERGLDLLEASLRSVMSEA
jgi:diaminobutyrate-2-oxoglutarate transaminase